MLELTPATVLLRRSPVTAGEALPPDVEDVQPGIYLVVKLRKWKHHSWKSLWYRGSKITYLNRKNRLGDGRPGSKPEELQELRKASGE